LKKWGLSPIPDEPTPLSNGSGAERAFNLRNYNLDTWGKLFNQRQLLVAISFIEKLRDLSEISKKPHEEEKIAITIYLAILINKIITYNNKLCRWESDGGFIAQPFARSSLSIIYDYFEANPFSESSGSWESALDWLNLCLLHIMQSVDDQGIISKNSSTDLPYSDNFFDGVFTDPPYYDNYPYSYLSDFFYVWLKRSIGHLYPELFVTPLTPKSNEIVLYGNKPGGWDEGKIFFETMLGKSFSEIFRVLKPNGISVIVYAHKSTEGWETLIKSILNSGLTVTAAWPIHTERKARPRSNRSASLASSIYMVCRKWKKEPIGFYKDVKKELKNYLDKKLEQLWNEGISGADFFVSAIGAAIEVFGKYTKVVDDTDNIIPVIRLLNDTREIVTNYAIRQVLHSEFSDEISKMTRFYILWRWAYGEARVTFDNALRMSQSTGIDIEYEWNKGFIVKESENIRVLGPEERDLEELQKSHELIDTLHLALILWKNKKKDSLDKLLKEKGYDKSDMFRRVGQAISESLPQENTEKKWLDGFLTGFRQNDSQSGTQTKLF
jgi:adenine-specific DNA methylase